MRSDRQVLCVSLHDVTPATLGDCAATVEFLDRHHIGPLALLVVPDYHGLGRMDRDERFCEFLRARERQGDEIVLHGFWHRDSDRPFRGLRDWIERRVRTDGEGEFSALDCGAARGRILRGLAVLRSAGWQPRGFVAPAWLMSPGTREALEDLPFEYCATRDYVVPLPAGDPIAAPSLVMSTRSAWRRCLCPLWNGARLRQRQHAPILRAALHPTDIRYPRIADLWRGMFAQLAGRRQLTEGQLVGHGQPSRLLHRIVTPR